MSTNLIIGCTGHRPQSIPNYNYSKLYDLARFALEQHQPSLVISGMALGWDTAIADAAINLGIPVEAAIPFDGQDAKWTPSSKSKYNELLSKCKAIVKVDSLLHYNPNKIEGYILWKLLKRNNYIVDRLVNSEHSTLIALLSDSSYSGTAQCVKYAIKNNVDVVNYWSYL